MMRIGIIGENFQNDACAFKSFLAPQYQGKIEFVPILKSLNGGSLPVAKVRSMLPTEIRKKNLKAFLCVLDLDNHLKLKGQQECFDKIVKDLTIESIFFLVYMELEALILADIDTFNTIYKIEGQYVKNPKVESDPKSILRKRTETAKRKYDENHAEEIFKVLRFDKVYKNHSGENSFQSFIDAFENKFKIERNKRKEI
jgi:hypothetical protein